MENNKKVVQNIENFKILAIKNNFAICFGNLEFLDLSISQQIFYVSSSSIPFSDLNEKESFNFDSLTSKEIYRLVKDYQKKLDEILKDNVLSFTNDYIVLIKNDKENKIYKLIKVCNSQLIDLIQYKELFNKMKLFNDENDYNLIYLRNCFLDSFFLKNLDAFDIDNLAKVLLDIFRNIKVGNDKKALQFLERNNQTDKEYVVKNCDIDLLKRSNFKFLHRPLIALIDASPLLKTINFYRRTVLNAGNRNEKVYDFNKLAKEIYKI